eukprot:2442798-Rhodomonas_salina.1
MPRMVTVMMSSLVTVHSCCVPGRPPSHCLLRLAQSQFDSAQLEVHPSADHWMPVATARAGSRIMMMMSRLNKGYD